MAKAIVNYNCGCGFKADNPLVASLHVDKTGHKMEVNGQILPDGNSKEKEAKKK